MNIDLIQIQKFFRHCSDVSKEILVGLKYFCVLRFWHGPLDLGFLHGRKKLFLTNVIISTLNSSVSTC